MMKLLQIIQALGSDNEKNIVKTVIENIDPALLPLQQGLTYSSYVGKSPFKAIILKITDESNIIIVKAGIFYTGIIAGCNCSDDPSPTDEQTEYCELQFNINKKSAEASVELLTD